jgi:hypothetical protein
VNSATQITATSPVGTAGATVSVSVTTAAGTSANTAADDFAYDPAPATHTVTFVPGVGGQIVGSNPQTVAHGGNCTAVTAQAAYGYVFTQWDDGVLTATRTVTNVQADQVHTASFRAANTVPPPETTGRFAAVTDAVGVNAGKALWDLSGDYPMTVAGHPLVMHLIHDTKGKLTGTATYTVAKATVVNLPVKGSVKGSAGAVVVSIALKGADPTKAVSVALSFRLTVNAGARELTGPLTGSVIINGTNALAPTEVHLPVPAPMDGTWTLQFDLARGTKGITGTAELVLSNAVDYDYVVRGKVVGQTAVVSLAATATDPAAKGIKIKATVVPLEGGWAGLQSFSGKGYGQTLAW